MINFRFWPLASPSCRLYEPEAVGAIGAYPPAWKPKAHKPTGWKRPRRDCGLRPEGPQGPTPRRDLLYRFALPFSGQPERTSNIECGSGFHKDFIYWEPAVSR